MRTHLSCWQNCFLSLGLWPQLCRASGFLEQHQALVLGCPHWQGRRFRPSHQVLFCLLVSCPLCLHSPGSSWPEEVISSSFTHSSESMGQNLKTFDLYMRERSRTQCVGMAALQYPST